MNKFFYFLLCIFGSSFCLGGESKFVILICSYNNATFIEANVMSALNQEYDNFRVIYVDDASTDDTESILKNIVNNPKNAALIKVIRNSSRKGSPLANHYYAIHNEIEDDEIVLLLDGDDALANTRVLQYLDQVYSKNNRSIWMTYGQFRGIQSGSIGFCCEYPKIIVELHAFRKYVHMPSHLKTFYAWLFKKICKEDLLYEGDFYKMTGDLAVVLPMIEMAAKHYKFISDVLYLYNEGNPISDHIVNFNLQMELAHYIRSLKPYDALD